MKTLNNYTQKINVKKRVAYTLLITVALSLLLLIKMDNPKTEPLMIQSPSPTVLEFCDLSDVKNKKCLTLDKVL